MTNERINYSWPKNTGRHSQRCKYACLWKRVLFLTKRFALLVMILIQRNLLFVVSGTQCTYGSQESPPAGKQEAYRPPRIKYSICCPIPGGGGGRVGTPLSRIHLAGVPPPPSGPGRGTPCLDLTRVSPGCGLTNKLKLLPSPILRMWVVQIGMINFYWHRLIRPCVKKLDTTLPHFESDLIQEK